MFGKSKETIDALNAQISSLRLELDKANKELDKKSFQVSVLYKTSENIAFILDLDLLLKLSLDMLIETLRVRGGTIILEEGGGFIVKEAKGVSNDEVGKLKIMPESGLIRLLKEAKKPLTIEELGRNTQVLKKEDYDNISVLSSVVFSPLIFKDQLVGIIALGAREARASFTSDDFDLFNSLSNQIAIALSNALLYKKLELSNKELDGKVYDLTNLHRMSKALSSVLDMYKLKELTADVFVEVAESERAVLFLINNEENKLIPHAWRGVKQAALENIEFELESEFIKSLLAGKGQLLVEDAKIKEELARYHCPVSVAQALAGLGLILYLPFIYKDEIVALMVLNKKISGEVFSASELELLSTFSSQAAIAIDNARLYELAVRDGLTKAYIHMYFQQQLEHEIRILHHRNKRVFSLIMADIDHFKKINDAHGHQAGDSILREIAKLIMNNARIFDIVARYGGEEFAIILPELDLEEAANIAEEIRKTVQDYVFLPESLALKVTLSFGVASFPDFAKTKEELISQADKALYRAKEKGRNKVILCSRT